VQVLSKCEFSGRSTIVWQRVPLFNNLKLSNIKDANALKRNDYLIEMSI